jgi:choline-glycine betaine transporter
LALPTLISATVAHLPSTRFAQGSTVNSMVRQIGAALGVAVLIAIVGERGSSQTPEVFRWAWGVILMPALAAGALAAALYRVPSGRSTALKERAGTGR